MTKRNFHKQSLMGIFLSYFRPHMGLFLLDMVCALVISLVDLGFPYLSRMCMYELIPEGRFQAFVAVILILLAAYLIRSVMQYIVTTGATPSACWWRRISAGTCSATSRPCPSAFTTKTAPAT